MNQKDLTRHIIFNGQSVDSGDVPLDASYSCLFTNSDQEILWGEIIVSGNLLWLEAVRKEGETAKQAAESVIARYLAYHEAPLNQVSVRVLISTDGLPSLEKNSEVQQFVYETFNGNALEGLLESTDPDKYLVEEIVTQPIQIVRKRLYLTAEERTLGILYPFYTIDNYNQLKEVEYFQEVGEADLESLGSEEHIYPAGQDALFLPALDYIYRGAIAYVDDNLQPVTPEVAISEGASFHAFCHAEDQQTLLSIDSYSGNSWLQSEVLDVPLEHHRLVFHAYVRQLQSEMALLSFDAYGSHYIRITAPLIHDSISGIELEAGQVLRRISTFHINGNLITHEAVVVNPDGTESKKYLLESPETDEIYHVFEE